MKRKSADRENNPPSSTAKHHIINGAITMAARETTNETLIQMKTQLTFQLRSASLVALALITLCPLTRSAHAQTVITSLPYFITVPGNYVLNSDLSYTTASGAAIHIDSNNVTLDFQGHSIAGTPSSSGFETYGVIGYNRANITIKNGTVTGFSWGIFLETNIGYESINDVIENMRISFMTNTGIWLRNAVACRIENCQISKINNTGITVNGSATIRNNQISDIKSPLGFQTEGILVYYAATFIVGNHINNCVIGVIGGKYQNNLTANCTIPFSGGIDAGGNN